MTMPQSRAEINSQQIQKMLDENAQILKAIIETQNVKGKSMDLIQYQQVLHRNLIYLAGLADPNADLNAILPSPGSSSLLQSQRAPPPNQTISSQSMTPPLSTGGMTPGPNTTGTSSQPWNHPTSQYNMKGYAPAPWMGQGNPPGPPGMNYSMQQRMQFDEQRRRQLLRMHQERLLRARQMQQQQQQHPAAAAAVGGPHRGGMFPPPPPAASSGYAMGPPPPTQPGGMGQQQQPGAFTQPPPVPTTGQPPITPAQPPPPNMSLDI